MEELKARARSGLHLALLEDCFAVSDRVTVLKNSARWRAAERRLTKHHLIQLMIGRDAETLLRVMKGASRCRRLDRLPVLEVDD